MVSKEIINRVKEYLKELALKNITISKAFIYGSYARGTASEESDIDLMIISPLFDGNTDEYAAAIWLSNLRSNYRIEPIAVGEKRFQTDDVSPLIAIVRQEGIEITGTNPA